MNAILFRVHFECTIFVACSTQTHPNTVSYTSSGLVASTLMLSEPHSFRHAPFHKKDAPQIMLIRISNAVWSGERYQQLKTFDFPCGSFGKSFPNEYTTSPITPKVDGQRSPRPAGGAPDRVIFPFATVSFAVASFCCLLVRTILPIDQCISAGIDSFYSKNMVTFTST